MAAQRCKFSLTHLNQRPAPPLLSIGLLHTFTTSSHLASRPLPANRYLDRPHSYDPPYPYPPQRWYKQANNGLYGNLRIRFGNMVSERTETKTRRVWRPNLQTKRLWSAALGRFVRVRVVTRVLRTIDKVGGLDAYLLGDKPARIKELGLGGWALRWRVMRTPVVREKMRAAREALGLTGPAPWERGWTVEGLRQEVSRDMGKEVDGEPKAAMDANEGQEQQGGGKLDREQAESELERDIDEHLDHDDAAAAKGEDGGIEFMAEEPPPNSRTKPEP